MNLPIYWSGNKWPDKAIAFGVFAQSMANRLLFGAYRYDKGKPSRGAKYFTRLKAEIDAYEKTGNREHLINAANYCFLENEAPEHPDSHFEHPNISVTRDLLGMKME